MIDVDDLTAEARLLTNLEDCAKLNADPEHAHSRADEAMLEYFDRTLSVQQSHAIRQAWCGVRKWYA